jgi:hypothetical protein
LAELITAYQGRDEDSYSIAEETGSTESATKKESQSA